MWNQNRERIFIVGFKDESDFNNEEIFRKNKNIRSSFFYNFLQNIKKSNRTKSIREIIDNKTQDESFYYTKEKSYMYDELKENIKSIDSINYATGKNTTSYKLMNEFTDLVNSSI